jgi:hypothetical protein
VDEHSHENNDLQDVPAHEVAMDSFPAVPVPTCGLAGGLHCALPLYGSARSIKSHLRMHGYRHLQREAVQCPWMGCARTLQWMSIPRHIQSTHLGVRFTCLNCGKQYTRPKGLAIHTASLKCYSQCLFRIKKNVLTAGYSSGAAHAGVEEPTHGS